MKDLDKILTYTLNLAMLEIQDDEKNDFYSQMDKIIGFVEKLNELNTDSVEPTLHILPLNNVTRPDQLESSLPREEFLKLTPLNNGDSVKVPQIIQDKV